MATTVYPLRRRAATVYPLRRRLVAAGGLLLLATGCGPPQPEPPADTDGPATGHGSPDSAHPSPQGTSAPTPGAVGIDETDDVDYPATARTYAERAVAAWSSPDLYRLDALAAAEVYDTIVDLPGPPDRHWTLIRCGPTDGESTCTFYNRDGDHLQLTVDHDRLGDAHAAVDVEFDAVGYPDDPRTYAEALLSAWQDGNTGRVEALATPGAVADLADLPDEFAHASLAYELRSDDDGTVAVTVTVTGDGETARTQLRTAQLGDRRAVRAVQSPAP